MRSIFTLSVVWLLIHVLIGCSEPFLPDLEGKSEEIPVINGRLLTGRAPEVELNWASSFNHTGQYPISDAVVWIEDELHYREYLAEDSPGNYFPINQDFIGNVGKTYMLHVELPDGKCFESTPERIEKPPVIDSLYAFPVERTIFVYNGSGDLMTEIKTGLTIQASISKDDSATCYFRFQTQAVAEITYWMASPIPGTIEVPVFEWESNVLDKVYDVESSLPDGAKETVPEHEAGFLEFYYSWTQAVPGRTAPYTEGWIVSMHVFSISPNVYRYYQSIEEQLEGKKRYLSPIPAQVEGNMHCTSHSNTIVLGIFEAASEVVCHKGFSWRGLDEYLSMELEDFPEDLGNGSQEIFPPEWWIRF